MNPPTLINFDLPSREEILRAIIAAGILANPHTDNESWGRVDEIGIAGEVHLGWVKRSVDRAYRILFDDLELDDKENRIESTDFD